MLTLKLEGQMPEQMQNDIPSPERIRADDAFARKCGAVGAISLGFGLAWWLALELTCGLLEMGDPAYKAGMDWGLVPAMVLGAFIGTAIIFR
ncbi:hypothetical protein KJ673_00140 [Patescibacteria group bacterium]|nr:hypothetical protein [Patescibacteria group bacterium]MCG2687327.1 hypothetical protein [Candidatus Parcubacteria bacterium]